MTTLRFEIKEEDAGLEIQQYLRTRQGISRRTVISLKHYPEGILLNGVHARTIDTISTGDVLEINLREETHPLPLCDTEVPTLFRDADVMVFNKPYDMPVHQSGGHIYGTLASVYAAMCKKEGVPAVFRAVNRIDKDTTGAVVVARHKIAAGKLWKSVAKRYWAVVRGVPDPPEGTILYPIEREAPYEMKRIISPDGEEAVTKYKVLAAAPDKSVALVGFHLLTGRTHQIRVHMSAKGWPLLGDELYGGPTDLIRRQALHCAGVAFTHPSSGELICLTAPLPDDLAELLQQKGIEWEAPLHAFVEELRDTDLTTVEEINENYRKGSRKESPLKGENP